MSRKSRKSQQALRALAKELEVPRSSRCRSLSRQVENRDDKHPQLADLRESGSIEQDADVVMFIYREEYYLKNKEPSEKGTDAWFKWGYADMQRAKRCRRTDHRQTAPWPDRHGRVCTLPVKSPAFPTSSATTICPSPDRLTASVR